MNRPIFFSSFFSTYWNGSKPLTSAAIVAEKPVVSKCVMGATPLLPARRLPQVSSVPTPTALTNPTPVTTTRRVKLYSSCRGSPLGGSVLRGLNVRLYVANRVFHRLDLLSVLIRNFDLERFFKS